MPLKCGQYLSEQTAPQQIDVGRGTRVLNLLEFKGLIS